MANCDDCRFGHWEETRFNNYDFVCDKEQKVSNWDFECEYFAEPIKPVFIDNVDVLYCDFYAPYAETSIIHCDGLGGECREHPDCSYKKLSRQIDELKQELENY